MIPEEPLKPRNNPFRASRLESLSYRFSDRSFDDIWKEIRQIGFRGALIGPKGSGKTTLLEEIEARMTESGRSVLLLRRRPAEAPLPALGPLDHRLFVLLDGAEQLGLFERLRFCRESKAAGGLLATGHHPLSWLPTLHLHQTSAELLIELVEELLDRDGFPNPWPRDQLRGLFHRQEGNLRECFRHLYDEAPERLNPSTNSLPTGRTASRE